MIVVGLLIGNDFNCGECVCMIICIVNSYGIYIRWLIIECIIEVFYYCNVVYNYGDNYWYKI